MNKFTKTMAAVAVSALMSAPAAAVEGWVDGARYATTSAKITYNGGGCSKETLNDRIMSIVFWDNFEFGEVDFLGDAGINTGWMDIDLIDWFDEVDVDGVGLAMVTKPGSQVLDAPRKAAMDLGLAEYFDMLGSLAAYAVLNCDVGIGPDEGTQITKFQGKFSKDGANLTVKFKAEGTYSDQNDKERNISVKLEAKNMDFTGFINVAAQ